jgi:hypothetical protein
MELLVCCVCLVLIGGSLYGAACIALGVDDVDED